MTTDQIIIYQTANGDTVIDVNLHEETIWLTQAEMVKLFQRDQSVISRHISNIFKEDELDEKSNMHFLHIAFKADFLVLKDVIDMSRDHRLIDVEKFDDLRLCRPDGFPRKISTKLDGAALCLIDNDFLFHIVNNTKPTGRIKESLTIF